MAFTAVAKADGIAKGSMQKVTEDGKEILIARVGDKYYAARNRCTHMGGNLSAGTLKGTVVTCPLHGSQFDLKNGAVVRWTNWPGLLVTLSKIFKPVKPLPIYKVKVEGNDILVDV